MKAIFWIIKLLFFFLALTFALKNTDGVTVRYYLGLQWQAPLMDTGLEWFANGDVSYTGSKYLDPLLDPRGLQPSVTLYGARIGISSPTQNWRFSLYGKNLTDESYYAQKTTQPLNAFISGGGTATAGGFVGWYAPPRTYGAEATLKF